MRKELRLLRNAATRYRKLHMQSPGRVNTYTLHKIEMSIHYLKQQREGEPIPDVVRREWTIPPRKKREVFYLKKWLIEEGVINNV